MLKSFDKVLSSLTKLCRAKQGKEANSMFPEIINFVIRLYNLTENAYLLCVYMLSFIYSKAQLRYLGSSYIAVPP